MSQPPPPPGLVLLPPAGALVSGRPGPRMVSTVDTSRFVKFFWLSNPSVCNVWWNTKKNWMHSLPGFQQTFLSVLFCCAFACIRSSVALLCNRAPEILHEDHHQWVKAKIDGKTCLTSWVSTLHGVTPQVLITCLT